ncbi:phytanoyl-CoA dioxygenase family protein [Pelagibacteraceae bacterium]|nr:phytanoyl-CoA dioxygenase family protein [Pelagibacteraceae bacterium]
MIISVKKHISNLKTFGITKIPNAVSQKKCDEYVNIANKTIDKWKKKEQPINSTCQIIKNPFNQDKKFLDLIYHPTVDKILSNLLDETYALINTSLINRKILDYKHAYHEIIGKTWHHDSRIINSERLPRGVFYIAWLLLNDFTNDNAQTLYVPKTHTKRIPSRPKRNYNYKCESIDDKKGTIIVIDAGLWHKGGNVKNNKDRWLSASYYGPWFVKPYYEYPKMKNIINCKNKKIKKIMHCDYWPPKIETYPSLTNMKLRNSGTLPKKFQRY